MLAMVALAVVPPIVSLSIPIDPALSPSPIVRIWAIASGGPGPVAPGAWSVGLVTAAVALLAWVLAGRISGRELADPDGLR